MTTEQHQTETAKALDEAQVTAAKATMYAIAECAREDYPTAKVVVLSESDQGSWLWVDCVETDDADNEELEDDGGYASCLYTDIWLLRELYSQYDVRGEIVSSRRTGITSFRMDVAKVLAECAPPTPVAPEPIRVEILHGRDPDSSCEMDVWINGVRVDKVTVESIDPGAGYEVEMWDEHTERVAADDTYSPDFRDAVVANRTEARSSQYIVGDKDAPGPYTLHYTSADGPGPDATWSVYREQYPSLEGSDGEPIDGSQEKVSTHDTEALADAEADRLQKS